MKYMLMLAVVGMLFASAAALGRFRMPTVVTTTCCKEVSSAMIKNIIDFKLQYAQPPCLKAIIFITTDQKQYCTDPNARWVAKRLKELSALKKQ
ncbi:hypothetical protein ACEWY4_019043 [Coilia grayii]|uniref:Chemokine interleukin-8-like domain-containing protein n=1 Tax=Coilia grayii TaxID=363190 RepID=A0ABD1JEY6_9TELE